jgi:hypothetical protein
MIFAKVGNADIYFTKLYYIHDKVTLDVRFVKIRIFYTQRHFLTSNLSLSKECSSIIKQKAKT